MLLLLLILALNNVKERRILGNVGQLVGRVDVNRVAKSTRRKVLPLGLLRPVTINCRCIPEDSNEDEQVLEKNDEKLKKKNEYTLGFKVEFIVLDTILIISLQLCT